MSLKVNDLSSERKTIKNLRILEDDADNVVKLELYEGQRGYQWDEKLVKGLIKDIYKAFNDSRNTERGYFLNTIYRVFDESDTENRRSQLYDGQQRITTISLLLLALYQECLRLSNWVLEEADKKLHDQGVDPRLACLAVWCCGKSLPYTNEAYKRYQEKHGLDDEQNYSEYLDYLSFPINLHVGANMKEAVALDNLVINIVQGNDVGASLGFAQEELNFETDTISVIDTNFKIIGETLKATDDNVFGLRKKLKNIAGVKKRFEKILEFADFILNKVVFVDVHIPKSNANGFFEVVNRPSLPLSEFEKLYSILFDLVGSKNFKEVQNLFTKLDAFKMRREYHDCFMNVLSLILHISPRVAAIDDIWETSPALTAQIFLSNIRNQTTPEKSSESLANAAKNFLRNLEYLVGKFEQHFVNLKGKGVVLLKVLCRLDDVSPGTISKEVYIIAAALLSFVKDEDGRFLTGSGSGRGKFLTETDRQNSGKGDTWRDIEKNVISLCFKSESGKDEDFKESMEILLGCKFAISNAVPEENGHECEVSAIVSFLRNRNLYNSGLKKYALRKRCFVYLLLSLEFKFNKGRGIPKIDQLDTNFQVDHIVAQGLDGAHSLGNLTILTAYDNNSQKKKEGFEKLKSLFMQNLGLWTPFLLEELWSKVGSVTSEEDFDRKITAEQVKLIMKDCLEVRENRLLGKVQEYLGGSDKVAAAQVSDIPKKATPTSETGIREVKKKTAKGKKKAAKKKKKATALTKGDRKRKDVKVDNSAQGKKPKISAVPAFDNPLVLGEKAKVKETGTVQKVKKRAREVEKERETVEEREEEKENQSAMKKQKLSRSMKKEFDSVGKMCDQADELLDLLSQFNSAGDARSLKRGAKAFTKSFEKWKGIVAENDFTWPGQYSLEHYQKVFSIETFENSISCLKSGDETPDGILSSIYFREFWKGIRDYLLLVNADSDLCLKSIDTSNKVDVIHSAGSQNPSACGNASSPGSGSRSSSSRNRRGP